MEVPVIQRITAVLKGVVKPLAGSCTLVAFSISIAFCPGPAGSQPSSTKVSAAEQSTRESERLLVLRDELKKSEALVESLARRKAERLAAADVAAADEAERDRTRVLSDIAGLKREIAATQPAAAATPAAPSTGDAKAAASKPTQPKAEKVAPWWDVYGKPRRTETVARDVSAQAPGPAPMRLEPNRGME